jgi:glucose dehydrogenase
MLLHGPEEQRKAINFYDCRSIGISWISTVWKAGGGGTPWEGMIYDPDLDLLFFGTGNPSTWYRALRGDGDSLYTACIVAVKASTGELAWYFQTTPGDSFHYDARNHSSKPIWH